MSGALVWSDVFPFWCRSCNSWPQSPNISHESQAPVIHTQRSVFEQKEVQHSWSMWVSQQDKKKCVYYNLTVSGSLWVSWQAEMHMVCWTTCSVFTQVCLQEGARWGRARLIHCDTCSVAKQQLLCKHKEKCFSSNTCRLLNLKYIREATNSKYVPLGGNNAKLCHAVVSFLKMLHTSDASVSLCNSVSHSFAMKLSWMDVPLRCCHSVWGHFSHDPPKTLSVILQETLTMVSKPQKHTQRQIYCTAHWSMNSK